MFLQKFLILRGQVFVMQSKIQNGKLPEVQIR